MQQVKLFDRRAVGVGLALAIVLGACSQGSTPAVSSVPTAVSDAATSVANGDPRFNATAAVGGGINASNTIDPAQVSAAFTSVPQASQLKLMANSSPPGAKGSDVTSISIIAQDSGGVLKGLDQAAKQSLGDALLTAAGAAWPNASVSLLVSDQTGAGGQIIGSRITGGPNTVIAT